MNERPESEMKDTPTPPAPTRSKMAEIEERLKGQKFDDPNVKAAEQTPVSAATPPPPSMPSGVLGLCEQVEATQQWTKEQDDQLVTYLKSSTSFYELAQKVKKSEWEVRDRLRYLHHSKEEFNVYRKSLGR